MTLAVTYDEKRCGYHVVSGEDRLFAYFTADPGSPETWIEFDVDKWRGEEIDMHFQIPIRTAKQPSTDLVESLIAREFRECGMSS